MKQKTPLTHQTPRFCKNRLMKIKDNPKMGNNPPQPTTPHYSERFVLIPNQIYDSQIEGIKLYMHNTTNSFKRITFWIEEIKEACDLMLRNVKEFKETKC